MTTNNTINDALSAILGALGFEAMAREVLTETQPERIAQYVGISIKQTRDAAKRKEMAGLFRQLGY